MSHKKFGKLMVVRPEDVALLGGNPSGYAGHCHLLLKQLHEDSRRAPRVFLCVPASAAGYETFLAGREPQPEWLFDYVAAGFRLQLGRLAELATGPCKRQPWIVAGTCPPNEGEAAAVMDDLCRLSDDRPTFFLPLAPGEEPSSVLPEWEQFLAKMLADLARVVSGE